MAAALYDSTTIYDATGVGYDGLGDGVTTMPTLGVFIAFDASPYDVDPVWTEVTTYVTSVNIDRGRSDDFSPFVSTAFVTFQNNTRQFDPFNTAGAYYGKLLPRKQIKIVALNNSVLYPVFRGFVEGFPVKFTEAGYASTVSVQCFDLLALLATAQMPDVLFERTYNYQFGYQANLLSGMVDGTPDVVKNPVHYYRCADQSPSTTIVDSGTKATNLLGSLNWSFGTQLAPLASKNSINIGKSNSYTATGGAATATGITVNLWFTLTDTTSTAYFLYVEHGYVRMRANIDASGYFHVEVRTPTFTWDAYDYTLNSGGKMRDGQPHHLQILYTPATTNAYGSVYQVYGVLDGVQVLLSNTGGGAVNTLGSDVVTVTNMTFQELTVYDFCAFGSTLYSFGLGKITESAVYRFRRLIDYTDVPQSRTNYDEIVIPGNIGTTSDFAGYPSNFVYVTDIDEYGTPMVDALNNTVISEYGFMYCDKNGKLQFKGRNYVYVNPTSNTNQATLGTGGIPFEPQIDMQLSGDQIRNDVTVTFSGDGNVNAVNSASISAHGTNSENIDTQITTISTSTTLAKYVALVAGNLTTNLSPLKIGVTKTTADYATILGLELLDRTTVVVAPQTGSSFTKIQLLNKISHSITSSSWDVTVDGSEQYTAWFILDKSTLNGIDKLQ
jgi:hypothetical protein